MKYRLKNIKQFEAFRITEGFAKMKEEWPEWLKEYDRSFPFTTSNTTSGFAYFKVGDWLILDESGILGFLSDSEFKDTYTLMEPEMITQGLPEALEATQWAVDVINKEYTRDGKFYMAKGWGAKLKAAANWATLGIKLSKI